MIRLGVPFTRKPLKRKAVLGLFPSVALLLLQWAARWSLPQTAGTPHLTIEARPWSQADRIFRTDARWLGGDAAYSVDLGGGRVLWLFGDSFIASRPGATRVESAMVRNSVAIESGYDPSQASLKFYWRTDRRKPRSFFPDRGRVWLWPSDGVRLGDRLLLFVTRVRPGNRKGSLGFENFGWSAFLVDNPDAEPSAWTLQRIEAPRNPWHVIVGSAVVPANDFLNVFAFAEPSHHIYLLRWPLMAAAKGDLSSPEWWCGVRRGWVGQARLTRLPAPVISEGSTEFSVNKDPQRRSFFEVQSVGFGASDIAIRWAGRVEGPWSAPMRVFRPPESERPDAFVYAGKAHPELSGADLVVTYVANSSDDRILSADPSIYYPRFVRLEFPPR